MAASRLVCTRHAAWASLARAPLGHGLPTARRTLPRTAAWSRATPGLRLYASEASAGAALDSTGPAPRSLARRILTVCALGVVFTGAGFFASASPALVSINRMVTPPSDAETLALFKAGDEATARVDEFLRSHPVAAELRAHPDYVESRPHLKMPDDMRAHMLTAGALTGPGKLVTPPLVFAEQGGNDITILAYVGDGVCGHPGIVHGGLVAALVDEGFARCCFPKLPNKLGMTAYLNINYRAPLPANTYVVLRGRTVRVEGRKAWVEGTLETLPAPGQKTTVYCDANALFVEPRQAAAMARILPVVR